MRLKRFFGYPLVVALPLLIFGLLTLLGPAPLPRLQDIVFDTYQRWHAKGRDPDSPVRIVAIDEKSLSEIGQFPWPRSVIATLTQKLADAGAVVVAFDVLFSEADQTSPGLLVKKLPTSAEREALEKAMTASTASYDVMFAQTMANIPVVLGLLGTDVGEPAKIKSGYGQVGDDPVNFLPSFPAAKNPLPVLYEAARGAGAINWFPDGDSVIRKVPTFVAIGGKVVPSLSLETIRVAMGADTIMVRASNASGQPAFGAQSGINTIRIGDGDRSIFIDTDSNGEVRLVARQSEPSSWISAASILDGSFNPQDIKDHIVFVGAVAIGLRDQRSTSVEEAIPGVEVHAQIVEQVLAGANLVRPDWMRGLEAFLILALGSLLAWILRRTRNMPLVSTVAGLSIPIMIACWSWILYVRQGVLFDAVMPSVGILSVFLAATVYHYQEAEHRRAEVRSMFGRFVTPAVVERLVEAPDRIVLGGEIRELTIMFSDVRNFTGIAETQSPEGVVSLIRRIHTPATEAVLRHSGTIDKFIGDGMMAFWNAPLDMPNHATLACKAALDIAVMAREFRDPPIQMGIGLHTGEACVGNLGSEQRLEYSALGDAVNLASRLEALTKLYGVEILVTEATSQAATGMPFLELDRAMVRGRQGAIGLFALHTGTADADFFRLQAAQAEILPPYRAGDFVQALALLEKNKAAYQNGYQRLFEYYSKQFNRLMGDPKFVWQGVTQL
ncbi:adenylate/guanylate cyclase domain-containing protein [Labrys okinawensis]|uniref:Adenylate/guanylate cyclase domain-containing protein n=1 Tax=Labrys okinawensis TaxID=346911 RepID=A0A2S9Q6H2_9HYPH|nr:adenylate/guanylate cyclase domain-containing protein [Labrys okinawensis]